MVRRTSPRDLPDWESTTDLPDLVRDKRATKRAGTARARRRNRRYENRLLNGQVRLAQDALIGDLDGEDTADGDGDPV
jgi:hypothetical protein